MTDSFNGQLPQSKADDREMISARSRLVSDLFDHMNQQRIAWVVMNNYEGLPDIIPSDIDISVPTEFFRRLDEFMVVFAKTMNVRIIQKLWHGNMKCAYILATAPNGAQEFVQFDFFTNFSTKGCPALIAHEELVAGCSAFRNFHVPRPEVELLFTAMRRLFKNDWSARHCSRIAELHQKVSGFDWMPTRYSWMRPTLENAIQGDVETTLARRAQDWKQLRTTAQGNLTTLERIANACQQIRRIAVRLRDETGQLIVLAAPHDSISASALKTLESVFHRRLLLTGQEKTILPVKLALLKRRKGLIFLLAGVNNHNGQAMAQRLGGMGLVDQVLYTSGYTGAQSAKPAWLEGIKAPAIAFATDAEAIEAIISMQAAKAAKAISRRGTQTSVTKTGQTSE